MRVLIVDTFYTPYLQQIYSCSSLVHQSWFNQHKAHFSNGFGTGDAYSYGLSRLGVEAIEIVANSAVLQLAWAREHEPALLELSSGIQQLLLILEAQIRWWKPSVLYVQDINWLPAAFLHHAKSLVEMLVGQNACPLSPGLDLSPYDLLLTSLPHYVDLFRRKGVRSAYFPIGFDERLLRRHRTDAARHHALTFVGGLGGSHSQGTRMLEEIARYLPLQVWGYGVDKLAHSSVLRSRWQGEAWAFQMYELLATSLITINRHINIADCYANNMRLYEATGMGACLLTDAKSNLATLFEPDQEVVTYNSVPEALSKLNQLLKYPKQAAAIAQRGQLRTLRDHTYSKHLKLLVELLQLHNPRFQARRVRDQHILVVCSQELAHRMPQSLKSVLSSQHLQRRYALLTDNTTQFTTFRNMSRWCIPNNADPIPVVKSCLDAFSPTLVLTVQIIDEFIPADHWLVSVQREAHSREILSLPVHAVPLQMEKPR